MTRSVLVVGGTSPIGSAVVQELQSSGLEVHVGSIDANEQGTLLLDVFDAASVQSALDSAAPEVVIDLARLPHGSPEEIDNSIAAYGGFLSLLTAGGVRKVVFASSAAIYGTGSPSPLREESPTPAPGAYADLKLRQERALFEHAGGGGAAAVALRIFNAYGRRLHQSLINQLAKATAPGPHVFTSDAFVRDYVHASDIARAVTAATLLEDAGVAGMALNVGTGIGTSNLDLLRMVGEVPWTDAGEPGTGSWSIADIGRAESVLGWRPLVRVDEAFQHPDSLLS